MSHACGVHSQVNIAILEKFPATVEYRIADPVSDNLDEVLVETCGITAAGPGATPYTPPDIAAIISWLDAEGYWVAEARRDIGDASARSSRGRVMRAAAMPVERRPRSRREIGLIRAQCRRTLGSIARHDLTQVNVDCPEPEAQDCVDRLSDDAVKLQFAELGVVVVDPFVAVATVNPSVEVTLCGHHTVIST